MTKGALYRLNDPDNESVFGYETLEVLEVRRASVTRTVNKTTAQTKYFVDYEWVVLATHPVGTTLGDRGPLTPEIIRISEDEIESEITAGRYYYDGGAVVRFQADLEVS